MTQVRKKPSFLAVYSWIVFLFLYLPIFVLVAFSFNNSKLNVVWTGFTLKWFAKLFQDGLILEATRNSLIVAVISTVASTAIGTLAAVGMHRYHFKGKGSMEALIYVPIVIPEIVMGISLLAFFALMGMKLGLATITMAHIAFSISFVVVTVRARLHGFDRALEEAAMDLGANERETFLKVTLPVIAPGVLAGALLAFTLSVDDFVITFFTAGPGSTTLPLKIYSMVKFGVSPEINALSTVILMVTLVLIVLSEKLRRA